MGSDIERAEAIRHASPPTIAHGIPREALEYLDANRAPRHVPEEVFIDGDTVVETGYLFDGDRQVGYEVRLHPQPSHLSPIETSTEPPKPGRYVLTIESKDDGFEQTRLHPSPLALSPDSHLDVLTVDGVNVDRSSVNHVVHYSYEQALTLHPILGVLLAADGKASPIFLSPDEAFDISGLPRSASD
jgi:hypothetical protein